MPVGRLRILYIPTHGSTGLHRQAGPLPPDVSQVLTKTNAEQLQQEPKSREILSTKTVGVLGAEASLRKKLERLENEKSKIKAKDRPSSTASIPAKAMMPPPPQKETMVTPGMRKSIKRDSGDTAEEAEAAWSVVTSPEKED